MSETYDAIVVGAGVIGCSVAAELAGRGWRTLSIDKLPAPGYGSTSSSSAVVRFSYSTLAGVSMSYEGLQFWRHWAERLEPARPDVIAHFIEMPMLALKLPGAQWSRMLPHFDALGIPYEDLDLAAFTARFPAFATGVFGPPVPLDDPRFGEDAAGDIAGAIVMPEAGYISDPQLAAQNLHAAAVARGAAFRFRTEVAAVESTGGRVTGVCLDSGELVAAPVVVNVAGPHSMIVNDMAGVSEGMTVRSRALRREVYVTPAPAGVDFAAEGAMVGDEDTGVYFRPEQGNNVLIGSAEPDCDELVWLDDPDTLDETLDEDEYQRLLLRTAQRIVDLPIPQRKRGLVSLYDATDDWLPIYDRSDLDGFYMAIGTSGNQFKNAGIAGHCMAELITAVEAGHDHDREPLVIRGPYTGFDIDLGTFSRRRDPNAATSMGVFG